MTTSKNQVRRERKGMRSLRNLANACFFMIGLNATCFASTVTLSWDPATGTDIVGYKIYYDVDSTAAPLSGTGATEGASPVSSPLPTATISGLDPSRPYYFAVTAYNSAGVESAYSNTIEIPELLPPTVSISSPANNSSVSGTVSVGASASDNVGVTRVEFYLNGALQGTDTGTPYFYSWNTSSLAAGTYTLMVKAYDAAGNVGQSSSVSVQVVNDTSAPTVAFTTPANGATVSGTVTVAATASDNVGVTKMELYDSGTLLVAGNVPPYSFAWDTTSVADGTHTLLFKGYDAAGNTKSSSVTVTVKNADTSAPVVSAFTIPVAASATTVAVSSFSATDNIGVTGYLITESSAAPLASASTWKAVPPTSFTFAGTGVRTAYAWAKDAAGNVSAQRSAAVTITLPDTSAPVVAAFVLPATASATTLPVSSLSATDNVRVTGYLITESATAPAASATGWSATVPTSFTFAGTGSRTAFAWAKDAAGNVSASRSATVTITLPDTTPPTVTVLSPFGGVRVGSSTTVAAAASDNVGISKISIYLDNSLQATSSASSISWNWKSRFAAGGAHVITVKAYDKANNVTSRSVTVYR